MGILGLNYAATATLRVPIHKAQPVVSYLKNLKFGQLEILGYSSLTRADALIDIQVRKVGTLDGNRVPLFLGPTNPIIRCIEKITPEAPLVRNN